MRIGPCSLLLALSFAPVLFSQSTATQTTKPAARKPAAKSVAATPAKPTATPVASTTPAAPSTCNCPTPTTVQRRYPPYSLKQTTTRVQTLADGTHVTTVTTTQIWRDTDGRSRTETFFTQQTGLVTHSVNVYDPVQRIQMNWLVSDSATKVVTVRHMPQPVAQPVTQPVIAAPQPTQRYYPTTSQSLPPQTIQGLYATGSRNTRTIPTGYEGNDRDITITSENWYSQALGLQLRYISDDPRSGKMTTEVTDVQQAAPDPSLFQPPEGYQLKENNQ